jgi:pimeloyl-ACP methyl ester carboxylesterase
MISRSEPDTRRLAVDGVELAYHERGAGDTLILIHGTGEQSELWGRGLDDLASRHRVIAYDRRGYGRSQHCPVRDYRRHVADAIEVIERRGDNPAVLVGHSSGASIALAVAAERPELVRALVLLEPPFHGLRNATRSFLAMIARAKLRQLRGRPVEGAEVFFRWATSYLSGGNAFDRYPAEVRELLLCNTRPVLAELDPHPTGSAFQHVPRRSVASIQVPTTVLVGELSQPLFHRCHAWLVRALPAIQTKRIPGASHDIANDAPAEFIAAVERAAARVPRHTGRG